MDKLSNLSKLILAAAGIVIVVAVIVLVENGSKGQRSPIAATNTASTTPNGATAPGTTGSAGAPTSRPKVPIIIVKFITPVPDDQWTLGVQNPISWNNAAKVTGQIVLLDANGKEVGVILSQAGSLQTSYAWDTRQIYLKRNSPMKKDITPGTYSIRLMFDGNGQPNITSAPFRIVSGS